MNNPLHILQTLDRHLTKPAEITIFGRAALALGFPNSPAAFATTHDVDAILPLSWLDAEDEEQEFRQRVRAAYETLKAQGLSITRDKAAVMRTLSTQFARGEMGHVYAAIVRLGE